MKKPQLNVDSLKEKIVKELDIAYISNTKSVVWAANVVLGKEALLMAVNAAGLKNPDLAKKPQAVQLVAEKPVSKLERRESKEEKQPTLSGILPKLGLIPMASSSGAGVKMKVDTAAEKPQPK